MKNADHIVVLITAASLKEAREITGLLLSQRLAACINVVPGVESSFWWKGKIDSAKEILLIIKTVMSRLEALIAAVKQVHSYEVPEIIALPVIGGNEDYLNWLTGESRPEIQS